MFSKGTMKDEGIDITIRNNPGHVLAPDDWQMVKDVKFGKLSAEDYCKWYKDLIRRRWKNRRKEILALAREGMARDVKLKCYCPQSASYCYAAIAAKFMNGLVKKLGNGT